MVNLLDELLGTEKVEQLRRKKGKDKVLPFKPRTFTPEQVKQHTELWAKHTPNGDELVKQGCYFDYNACNRVRYFFKSYLCIEHKNKCIPFRLVRWQNRKIISPLFGWKRPDGTRVFRTLFLYIPKKNGKSTLCAGILLYLLVYDGERVAKVYAAAGDKEQAGIIYDEVSNMIGNSRLLASKLEVRDSYKLVKYAKTRSKLKALSSVAKTKEGLNCHAYVVDELHILPNDALTSTLEHSGRARVQPLAFKVTTAGNDVNLPWYEEYKYAKKVLAGTLKDVTYLPVIYEIDQGEDVEDRKLWYRANPSLGSIFSMEDMERSYLKAKESPREYASWLRYMINYIVTDVSKPLSSLIWNLATETENDYLLKQACYGGLDLASTRDMVCLCLLFPRDTSYSARFWYWVPKHIGKNREATVYRKYVEWEKAGWLKFTESEVADYDVIFEDIVLLSKMYRIKNIQVDKSHNAMHILPRLDKAGIKVEAFAQSVYSYNSPCKEFEVLYTNKRILHDDNPIIAWNIDNVTYDFDPHGRCMPSRTRSVEKIDGFIAMMMSLAQAIKEVVSRPKIKDRGIVYV